MFFFSKLINGSSRTQPSLFPCCPVRRSSNNRYFVSQFQWCVKIGFSSSMIFPLTKHQKAMVANFTWQVLVPPLQAAVSLDHPLLVLTVRAQPSHRHPSQHWPEWGCGREVNQEIGTGVFLYHLPRSTPLYHMQHSGGGQGKEVYKRREKRGRKAGFPRWLEAGGKGKIMRHCTTFCNQKNANSREPTNTGWEPGLKGTGRGRFKPPCPPPHHIGAEPFVANLFCHMHLVPGHFSCTLISWIMPGGEGGREVERERPKTCWPVAADLKTMAHVWSEGKKLKRDCGLEVSPFYRSLISHPEWRGLGWVKGSSLYNQNYILENIYTQPKRGSWNSQVFF